MSVFLRILRRCRELGDEDSVHALRTQTRRVLACLDLLGAVGKFSGLRLVRRSLQRLFRASAALRDVHVQLQLEAELGAAGESAIELRRELREGKKEERRRLRKKLGGSKLVRRLAAFRARLRRRIHPMKSEAQVRTSLDEMLAKKFDRMVRRQRRGLVEPACLHRARVGLKKFRYMAEILAPISGPSSSAELRRLHRCQTVMGDIHDLDLMLERLGDTAPVPPQFKSLAADFFRKRRRQLWHRHRAAAVKWIRPGPGITRMRTALTHLPGI